MINDRFVEQFGYFLGQIIIKFYHIRLAGLCRPISLTALFYMTKREKRIVFLNPFSQQFGVVYNLKWGRSAHTSAKRSVDGSTPSDGPKFSSIL